MMTGFRHTLSRLMLAGLLVLICSVVAPAQAESIEVDQLQRDNGLLQRKVARLEAQVAALRHELDSPGATEIIGGIGYIVGLFGVAGWWSARKEHGQKRD